MAKLIGKTLYAYVQQNQGASVEDIAAALNSSVGTVLYVFRNTQRPNSLTPLEKQEDCNGVCRLYTKGYGFEEEVVESEENMLSKAITAMLNVVALQVRRQIDAELDTLIATEVNAALADVQDRIRSRLAAGYVSPAPVVAEKAPVVAEKAPVVAEKAPPRILSAPLTKPEHVKAVEPPFEFTNPEGFADVVNLVCRKTAHVEKPPILVKATTPTAPVETSKVKVLIVGLHDNKQQLIKQEYRSCFDLRMLNPDQLKQVAAHAKPGTKVFTMADFVSHCHSDAIAAKGVDQQVIRGGMSSLRDALTNFYVSLTDAA
jgi:hypothetical protein